MHLDSDILEISEKASWDKAFDATYAATDSLTYSTVTKIPSWDSASGAMCDAEGEFLNEL